MIELYTKDDILLAIYEARDDEGKRITIPLPLTRPVMIEPVSMALLPHGLRVKQVTPQRDSHIQLGSLVWLTRAPKVFDMGLIIDQGPVADGDLYTQVFNVTDHRIRLERGDVLSWLIEL